MTASLPADIPEAQTPTRPECPLCAAVGPRRALQVPSWVVKAPPYIQCERCGIVFHEQPVSASNRPPLLLESYMRDATWKLPTNLARLNWLRRHAPVRPGRAVDIGTKDGTVLKLLADTGWQVSGHDPDQRFHPFAKQMYGVDIRPEWFTADVVGPGSLDLVTAYHVLEHIPEPLMWLSEIHKALKPDGVLHIETPNLRLIEARQLMPGHVVLYTRHTLRQLLERAGFRVVAMSEFAPGGNRTYDQLAAVAQRDRPKPVQFTMSRFDRAAQRYLGRPTPDLPPSPILTIRIYRAVRRRIRRAFRRACYRAL